MKVLFAGSSLHDSLANLAGLELRPPARRGDIHQAVSDGATAIGLVDGEFGQSASVLHKEILFALHRGVPVLGASSMGALRFAECAAFGMIGVGKIAHDYHSGRLNDDADVALLMAPAEFGWAPLSEPLVDVAATLEGLVSNGLITAAEHAELWERASQLHFSERTAETILAGHPDSDRLRALYTARHVSQKRIDAEELVEALRTLDPDGWRPPLFNPSRSFFWSPVAG
ncbi:MAG TPA: TfuA-like protein [Devosia sp.]|nr:TfuA-like protein [Devosia sp.]